MKICFHKFSSKNLSFIVFENQSFKVLTVNFNSTENNSARKVDLSRTNTADAAFLKCSLITKWDMFLFEMAQVIHFLRGLLKALKNDNFIYVKGCFK